MNIDPNQVFFILVSLVFAAALFFGFEHRVGGENKSNFDRDLIGWRRYLVSIMLFVNAFVLLFSFSHGLFGIGLIVTVGYLLGRHKN